MGLFNTILLNRRCPHCGEKVEWDTKRMMVDDVYPVENVLRRYEVNERMDASVYTLCDGCWWWTNLEMEKGKVIEKTVKSWKVRKPRWKKE